MLPDRVRLREMSSKPESTHPKRVERQVLQFKGVVFFCLDSKLKSSSSPSLTTPPVPYSSWRKFELNLASTTSKMKRSVSSCPDVFAPNTDTLV